MGRQLDREAGEMLQKISEGQGIRVTPVVQIEAIEGEGSASGVRLADGTVFPAELVIVSCGVRANTAIARKRVSGQIARSSSTRRWRQACRISTHAVTALSMRA